MQQTRCSLSFNKTPSDEYLPLFQNVCAVLQDIGDVDAEFCGGFGDTRIYTSYITARIWWTEILPAGPPMVYIYFVFGRTDFASFRYILDKGDAPLCDMMEGAWVPLSSMESIVRRDLKKFCSTLSAKLLKKL